MVLRLTSPQVAKAGDEEFSHGDEFETRSGDSASGGARDRASSPRELHSQKNMVAADVALDLVLQEIVQQARLATTATGAFIGVLRANKIVCQVASGANAGEFVKYLNRDRRIVDACLSGGSVQTCRDSEASENLDGSACRTLGARCVVIVPVVDEADKQLGVFGVFSPQVDAFSHANIVALQSQARRIADAMAQVNRYASARSSTSSAPLPAATPIRPARRRRPVIAGLAAGFVGILAILLAVGWTVGRAISKREARASATVSAPVLSPVPSPTPTDTAPTDTTPPAVSTASAQPSTGQISPDHASSGNIASADATTSRRSNGNPQKRSRPSPVEGVVVKPAVPAVDVTVELTPTAPAGKKISTSSGAHVPDLEVENALDDASAALPPAKPVDMYKAFNQSSIKATPQPAKTSASANAVSKSPMSSAALALPPRDAVRITRAPDPPTIAPPTSAAISQNASPANTNPAPGGPVVITEQAALERVVDRVKPDYPEEAMAQQVQGAVTVDVIVGKDGHVENATPVDGDARLQPAAVKAVRKWGFAPLLRSGHFVSFETHITLRFALP
jgi:protein TonB